MPGGSKKGFPYEREIARKLSLWLTDSVRDDVLWRTEGSGGRATNRMKSGKRLPFSYGDLTVKDPTNQRAIDFISNVLIEIKRGYSKAGKNDVLDLIDKKKGTPLLIQWWAKASEEASQAGRKYVWILFKRDRKENCILIDATDEHWINGDAIFIRAGFRYSTAPRTFGVLRLDDFLDQALPLWFCSKEGE